MNIFKIGENDQKSINSDTLETILKFYLNKPSPIKDKNPIPYLGPALPNMLDEIQREIIFYNYRDMVLNRWYLHDSMRSRQFPEIYEWEWIYKVGIFYCIFSKIVKLITTPSFISF